MLSASKINNANKASKYYLSEDNYYLSEIDAKDSSLWWGEGAARLGLNGKVNEKELQSLFAGRLPNGETIGLQKEGANHRAGYDICFHAPKSVSILALDGGDERFYNAHLAAVKDTLKFIQRDCAQAKVYKDEQVSFENTKNLTVALIKHVTSRKLDPHLHTHALIINATERLDHSWRALASSKTKTSDQVNGFMERYYNNQLYYGVIYKSFLADKIKALGCEIETVGAHGLWEIKGVPAKALEQMSKRRQEIEEKSAELNYLSLKAQDVITLDTRKEKAKNIKLDDLKKIWRKELDQAGFSSEKFLEELGQEKQEKPVKETALSIQENAKIAVLDAIEHISQFDLKLDYTKTITKAMEFAIGKCTHFDIVEAFNEVIADGTLIPIDKSAATFVTKEAIDTEKTILDFVAKAKNSVDPIIPKERTINNIIDSKAKQTVLGILQSRDRINLVEHNNFDNKELIADLLHLAESAGKTVRILFPNRLIANDANQNIKRQPSSIWQWLVSLNKPAIGESVAGFNYSYKEELERSFLLFRKEKDVIVVDAAENLGSNDMRTMLELTDKTDAKVILLNNVQAKQGFRSGNPLQTLRQAQVTSFKIDSHVQQKEFIPHVTAVEADNERTKQVARAFAKREKQEVSTLVVVGSKNQMKATNEAIREELKNLGKLARLEHKITVLNPVYLSKPERTLAKQYREGMVIRTYYDKSSEDWVVEKIDKERNLLTLNCGTRHKILNPKTAAKEFSAFAIFAREDLPLSQGDKLIATSNMNNLGIRNAEKYIVKNIDEKYAMLFDGQKFSHISLKELKDAHFQYDYATTLSKTTKQEAAHVIADMKAYTLDKSILNELIARSKESLTIFTNDIDAAKKRFDVNTIKITAAETILDASRIDRFINDQTVTEIKEDIERAVALLHPKDDSASKKAVEFALEKITSRNAGFTHKHLVTEALEYALKEQHNVTYENIMDVISEKRKSGELVMGRYFDDGTRWTTKEILDLEHSIINDLKNGKNKVTALLPDKDLKGKLDITNLTFDQKNACQLIATSCDQFVVVQGYAGTGKTTMFSEIQEMVQPKDIEMLALAPTHRAVKELKSIDIEAQTLKSFLQEQQNIRTDLGKKLIILDEASMVSNRDFSQFLQVVGDNKCHVVLSGDIAQHIAIESGKPFEVAQRANILQTAYLKEIVRQKNPVLKEAVESTINGDYHAAFDKIASEDARKHIAREKKHFFFDKLNSSIVEIDNNKLKAGKKTLEEIVAEDYLSRTPETREKTVVIVHANHDRRKITGFIRQGLKEQGVISREGILTDCLVSKEMTPVEYKSLESYKAGDVIKLGKEYYHVAEKAGKTESDRITKSILLRSGTGKEKYFYPEKYADKYSIELYEHTKQELAVGDVIRFTKTDKSRNRYANFECIVKETTKDRVIIQHKDSKELFVLEPNNLKDAHWDYAQTVTGYGIQGGSKTYAIDFEVSYRKHLANQRSFYIGTSRAAEHLTIYTNNKTALLDRILSNKGDKYAAVEVTGELGISNNNTKNFTKKISNTHDTQQKFYDAKEIHRYLQNSAETILEKLLGRPNQKLSSTSEWRYGNKGSLAIKMAGDKKGSWHNFETGESGNLLTLLQKEMGLTFRDTLRHAANMLNNSEFLTRKPHLRSERNERSEANKFSNKIDQKISNYVKKLAQESQPIKGTIVEKYLKETRGINDLNSADIRYHPEVFTSKDETEKYLPAMLAIGRDKDGNIKCVQATYLDPKTFNKAELAVNKRTYASPIGHGVCLQRSNEKEKISCIAEGVETGLSVKDTTKNSEVISVLGKSNFLHIETKNLGQKVIFCLDNDGTKTLTDSIFHKAAERLIALGKEVYISMPDQIKNSKTDFNDVARLSGIGAVKGILDKSISYQNWRSNLEKSGINLKLNNAINAAANNNISTQKNADREFMRLATSIKNEQALQKSERNNLSKNIDLSKSEAQKALAKTEREIY